MNRKSTCNRSMRSLAVTTEKRWPGATGSAEGFAAFVRKHWELWDKLIKQQGLRLD